MDYKNNVEEFGDFQKNLENLYLSLNSWVNMVDSYFHPPEHSGAFYISIQEIY